MESVDVRRRKREEERRKRESERGEFDFVRFSPASCLLFLEKDTESCLSRSLWRRD